MRVCEFILLLTAVSWVGAANILYIATVASKSHFIWHRPLIYALAAKGHNVTAVSVDVEVDPPPNVTFIEIEKSYEAFSEEAEQFMALGKADPIFMISEMAKFSSKACEYTLSTAGFQQLKAYPDDFKVDVILNDYLTGPCLSAFAQHKFGRPPYIGLTAYLAQTTTLSMTGAFSYPSLIPYHMYDATQPMSFLQRFMNFIYYIYDEICKHSDMLPAMTMLIRTVSPDIPYVGDLERDARLVLLNSHPVIQFSEPAMPNVISVGGMQIVPPKELPEDLAMVLDSSTRPVVLFSLGTNARSDALGSERIQSILSAMWDLSEYQFLWKFESEFEQYQVPKNVHIRKWMPQNDLLAHPKVKLFITHSGLLSTQEAVWHGVPIIGFPLFADQYVNIEYCIQLGVGKRLSIEDLKAQDLVGAVREVMEDGKYRENMAKLSKTFRDQPEHPLDRAVWWVEWVIRNPDARMLQSHAVALHWFQKYSVDVISVIVLAFVALALLECWFVPKVARWKRQRAAKTKQE